MAALRGSRWRAVWLGGVLACLAAAEAAAFARDAWRRAGWYTQFEAAEADARASGRPRFVVFDASWCSWCQQYKCDTLDQPAVRSALKRDFIPVAVDADARPDLMRRYRGMGLPFTLVLAPDGNVRARFVGVMRPDDLLSLLAVSRRASPVAQPAPALHARVTTLDRPGYAAFRAAWLRHLESLYEPERAALSGRYDSGASQKRTPVLAWLWLMDHGLWPSRMVAAGRAERQRLWDTVGTGFFNFIDPGRGDYLETSKLLEANAWMAAWQAQLGAHDPEAARTAQHTRVFLREVLADRAGGGYFQAQSADNAYYALKPAERLHRAPPPLDRVKRADTHAQAAWALLRVARFSNESRAIDDAVRALDFVLKTLWHEGRLYHAWRDGERMQADVPHSMFWVLAAGEAVERARPDPVRRATLDAIARRGARWLSEAMQQDAATRLDNELAGLVAWVASQPISGRRLPAGARDWALRQLRIEAETPPDDLVVGLWAWEAALAQR